MVAKAHDGTPRSSARESAVHFLARQSQTAIRWVVYALLLVTTLTMVIFSFWAIIPATVLIVAYLALMIVNLVEKRSDRRRDETPEAAATSAPGAAERERAEAEPGGSAAAEPEDERGIIPMPLLKHQTLLVSIGVAVALALAIILAATFFGGARMLLGVLFLFAYIILLTSPAWGAALEDDLEAQTRGPGSEHRHA